MRVAAPRKKHTARRRLLRRTIHRRRTYLTPLISKDV